MNLMQTKVIGTNQHDCPAANLPVVQLWERAVPSIIAQYGRTLETRIADGASGGGEHPSPIDVTTPSAAQPPDSASRLVLAVPRYHLCSEAGSVTSDSTCFWIRLTFPPRASGAFDAEDKLKSEVSG